MWDKKSKIDKGKVYGWKRECQQIQLMVCKSEDQQIR